MHVVRLVSCIWRPIFKSRKSEWLTETAKSQGFECIFYPKFHCELNFIEMIWGWLKARHRLYCKYDFNDLLRTLPQSIEECLPISFVRRCARQCFRFIDGYYHGMSGLLLQFACKKYSSHRCLPRSFVTASIQSEFDLYLAKLKKKLES